MIFFLLCVTVLPLLPGLTFVRWKKEKESIALTECYLSGLLFLFLLAEISACIVIRTGKSFSEYCILLGGSVLVCSLLSLVLNLKTAKELLLRVRGFFAEARENFGTRREQRVQYAVIAALLLLQIAGYFLYAPDTGGDTTVETVSAALLTDTVFGYNPVTGQALRYGMYPLYKFASLPLLYGALCRAGGISPDVLLLSAVPVWLLLVFSALLNLWSGALFERQREKRNLFLIFSGLLIVFGDGEKSSFAYALLHGGWKGEALAAALVVPFGAYIVWLLFLKKERLYAAAGILLSACGIIFTRPMFLPDSFAFTAEDSGRTWGLALLALLAFYLVREKTKKKWKKREAVFLSFALVTGIVSGSALLILAAAYAGTCMWSVAGEWKRGGKVFAGFLILICMTGTIYPFGSEAVKKGQVPQAEEELLDKIETLAQAYKGEVMLLAPEHVMERARIQSGAIILPYGKDLWYENCNREIADVYTEEELILYEQMKLVDIQPDTVAAMAAQMRCDILVLPEEMSAEAMRQHGWREEETLAGGVIYCK